MVDLTDVLKIHIETYWRCTAILFKYVYSSETIYTYQHKQCNHVFEINSWHQDKYIKKAVYRQRDRPMDVLSEVARDLVMEHNFVDSSEYRLWCRIGYHGNNGRDEAGMKILLFYSHIVNKHHEGQNKSLGLYPGNTRPPS